MPFKNPLSGVVSAVGGVVHNISENGLKMPDRSGLDESSSATAAPPTKQSPSLPSVGAPSTPSDAGSSALTSVLSSLILKSTAPLVKTIDGDISKQVSSVEQAVIFAAVGGAAGAMLYENNRIAGALAGFAAGLYFGAK